MDIQCQFARCPRQDAIEVKLPDRTTGFYCEEHGDTVASRVARRMKLRASNRDRVSTYVQHQPGGEQ